MSASQETETVDEQSTARKRLVVALVAVLLLAAGYATWEWVSADPDPATLASRALASPDRNDRARYASRLSLVQDPGIAIPLLRKVAAETKDFEVLIPVLARLSSFNDNQSLTQFVKAMDHENQDVRKVAYDSMVRHYGGKLPGNLSYDPGAPSAVRSRTTSKLLDLINAPPPPMP